MRKIYDFFRFALACGLLFLSGYLLAKPRNSADQTFAPVVSLLAVYYLWRFRKPQDPFTLR